MTYLASFSGQETHVSPLRDHSVFFCNDECMPKLLSFISQLNCERCDVRIRFGGILAKSLQGNTSVLQWKKTRVVSTSRELTRWSGDVIRRPGMKNFNAVSHNRARPYFRIQHGRGEVRARRVYLNVHSVTGNVVDTEWSVEFWRWKCYREFGNNT